jgi:hypothetical protein
LFLTGRFGGYPTVVGSCFPPKAGYRLLRAARMIAAMSGRIGKTIMWWLSIVYAVSVGIMFMLASPFAAVTFAWVGAIALGLGWTLRAALTRRASSG